MRNWTNLIRHLNTSLFVHRLILVMGLDILGWEIYIWGCISIRRLFSALLRIFRLDLILLFLMLISAFFFLRLDLWKMLFRGFGKEWPSFHRIRLLLTTLLHISKTLLMRKIYQLLQLSLICLLDIQIQNLRRVNF